MAEKTSHNKLNRNNSVVLTIVLVVLVGICGCTTTPSEKQEEKTLLTITVGSYENVYSLDDLTSLDTVTGQGSYINKAGTITGPDTYTGVTVRELLDTIPFLPSNYTIHALASDNYSINYTIDELNGHVSIFNETGDEIGTGNLTMILAYTENGVFLNETTKGPLRIAFVGTEPSLTDSAMWLSHLVKIEII